MTQDTRTENSNFIERKELFQGGELGLMAEASELGWRPGFVPSMVRIENEDETDSVFDFDREMADGEEVIGWVYTEREPRGLMTRFFSVWND